jgi:hypothetical protein
MAERVQVGERETHAVRMIRADVGGAAAGAPDVDADERHLPRREVGDQRVVVVDADQDGRFEAMLDADVARREQQGVIARLREPSRDRRQHLAEEDQREVAVPGVIADDNGDESRLLGCQRACDRIGAVADRSGHLANALTRLHAHVALVVQRAGDSRDRDAGAYCDILDRRSLAHEGNDTACRVLVWGFRD